MPSNIHDEIQNNSTIITACLIICILSIPLLIGQIHILFIKGNSMDPMLPPGSIGVCPSVDGWDVEEGDVVSYEMQDRWITHKVVDTDTEYNLLDEPTAKKIQPKGINNSELDPSIPADLVQCRMRLAVTPRFDIKIF